jgi:hypothetical protein
MRAEAIFGTYLTLLNCAPLLVRWRWGAKAAIAAALGGLALTYLVNHLMNAYSPYPHMLLDPPRPPPGSSSLTGALGRAFDRAMEKIVWTEGPGAAAIMGAILAAVWHAVLMTDVRLKRRVAGLPVTARRNAEIAHAILLPALAAALLALGEFYGLRFLFNHVL